MDVEFPNLTWMEHDGSNAKPPEDSQEWVAIIRENVGRAVRVILVSSGRGQWWVRTADQPRVNVGPGPWETAPIDCREAVKAVLRAAGKPITE